MIAGSGGADKLGKLLDVLANPKETRKLLKSLAEAEASAEMALAELTKAEKRQKEAAVERGRGQEAREAAVSKRESAVLGKQAGLNRHETDLADVKAKLDERTAELERRLSLLTRTEGESKKAMANVRARQDDVDGRENAVKLREVEVARLAADYERRL